MDELKKKVLLDLFASPWTIVPLVGGLSAWMLSWAVDGNTALNLIGLGGIMTGLGIQASRLIFGIEQLTEKAYSYLTEKQKRERNERLDQLSVKLNKDGDPRSEECLKRLRRLYASLEEDAPRDQASLVFREKVDKLFAAAVKQLERSWKLWEKAKRLPGRTGDPLLAERKKAVDEVVLTVNHLTKTVEQYQALQIEDSDDELSRLREELDRTIEVARRTDEYMDSLDTKSAYDEAEFES